MYAGENQDNLDYLIFSSNQLVTQSVLVLAMNQPDATPPCVPHNSCSLNLILMPLCPFEDWVEEMLEQQKKKDLLGNQVTWVFARNRGSHSPPIPS